MVAETKDKNPQIRAINIPFKQVEAASGVAASPVTTYPMECSPDGTAFLEMMLPPHFTEQEIYSISVTKGIHKFAPASISDLHRIQVLRYYPGSSGVLFLIRAAEEEPEAGHGARYHYYIATFDTDGQYKGRIQLDESLFALGQLAGFESGVFAAYGMDMDTRHLALGLINSDGSLLRFLEPPSALKKWWYTSTTKYSDPGGPPPSFPNTQMVPFRDRILLVHINSKAPVLEVHESGEVREVKLSLPEGQVINSFIAAQNRWYVRTLDESAAAAERGSMSPNLFEVDPETGLPVAQLRPEGVLSGEIACLQDGSFIAFKRDNDTGKLIALRGDIGKH